MQRTSLSHKLKNYVPLDEESDVGSPSSRALLHPLPLNKASRRRAVVIHVASVLWILGLTAVLCMFWGLLFYSSISTEELLSYCEIDPNSAAENYFGINLETRTFLTYTQARLIDVSWDLFIGQCGWVIQAYLLIRVSSSAIALLME